MISLIIFKNKTHIFGEETLFCRFIRFLYEIVHESKENRIFSLVWFLKSKKSLSRSFLVFGVERMFMSREPTAGKLGQIIKKHRNVRSLSLSLGPGFSPSLNIADSIRQQSTIYLEHKRETTPNKCIAGCCREGDRVLDTKLFVKEKVRENMWGQQSFVLCFKKLAPAWVFSLFLNKYYNSMKINRPKIFFLFLSFHSLAWLFSGIITVLIKDQNNWAKILSFTIYSLTVNFGPLYLYLLLKNCSKTSECRVFLNQQ